MYFGIFKKNEVFDENERSSPKNMPKPIEKINNKTNKNTVEMNCCFSRNDRGNSILVTKHDQIFKFPKCYLPKNSLNGNSFKITIEEVEKVDQKYERIRFLQNKYFFK